MIRAVAKLFEPLLRLLLPGAGRHRSPVTLPVMLPVSFPEPSPSLPRVNPPTARRPRPHASMLRGEDSRLVRPYVTAYEQWEEARQRRALLMVGHGLYFDPGPSHGVKVSVCDE
ncbi:hypothetical protein [Streptomyces gilvosporeus]|uniref:Uncharacterized protein n=1 Tax=Streptomyces gilvosporeus TaxID=553510 RepID=A0A1V0TUA7_9ACTN|nr:hypothetical protein [Streptomyces gilvosporeus]ARF56272.1 hypothetical protein B1H19_20675 [Streptomyces gilvosporeus]